MSYPGFAKVGSGNFTCYEAAMPNPVRSFAKNIFDSVVSVNGNTADETEATARFTLKNRFDNIKNAMNDGVEVFDIVAYNYTLYELVDSWDDVNADGIIHFNSESLGCYSAGVDKQLPDGYKSAQNNCTDLEKHDHSDPNGVADAYCGLLPETTFFFFNQDHEETGNNNIIMFLVSALLTDPNFKDVHSYPETFPQFNVARDSKGLMRDIKKMKAVETSSFNSEQKAEFESAIKTAEAAIENTNIKAADFDAAKDNFYKVTDRILNGEPKAEKKSFDFDSVLVKIFRFISDTLYKILGGKGFSDILRIK